MRMVRIIFQDGSVVEDSLMGYTLPYNERTRYIYEFLMRYEPRESSPKREEEIKEVLVK